MRLPNNVHTARPWRIHDIARDFRLLDVWALPTPGGPDDFPRLAELMTSFDPTKGSSRLARTLWAIRSKAGDWLGWDDDKEGLVAFTPLYEADDERALEIVNRTVHGILHVGWVKAGDGYRGEMAVYVKPNGLLGTAYMAAITPFRHFVVYPAMLRDLERRWAASRRPSPRPSRPAPGTAARSPGAGGGAASAGG
jgi:hypothetical protein